jgi:hypothetical protein
MRDLTGQRFGSLVAERPAGKESSGHMAWLCYCDCGNSHVALSGSLLQGKTKRCRVCTKTNRDPSMTVVVRIDCWYHGTGVHGGFAVASDPHGAALLHTGWTTTGQRVRNPPSSLVLARKAMDLLAVQQHIRLMREKEGYCAWAKAVGVHIEAHMLTPLDRMREVWLAAGGDAAVCEERIARTIAGAQGQLPQTGARKKTLKSRFLPVVH